MITERTYPPRRYGEVGPGLSEAGSPAGDARLYHRVHLIRCGRRGRKTRSVLLCRKLRDGHEMLATDDRGALEAAEKILGGPPENAAESLFPANQPINSERHDPATGEFWPGTGRQNIGWRYATGAEVARLAEAGQLAWLPFVI